MSMLVREKIDTISFRSVGREKIARAAKCLGYAEGQQIRMFTDFVQLLGPGGALPVGRAERRSLVANDGMPFELSVAWGKSSIQLRFLVEPLSESGIPGDDVVAEAISLLAGKSGVSLSGYAKIRDIFSRPATSPPFATWLSGAYGKKSGALYKAYLNPRQVSSAPWDTVTDAMSALGLQDAWARTKELYPRSVCTPAYFSLDLCSATTARVKVYMKHESTNGLEAVLSLGPGYRPLAAACGTLASGRGTRRKFLQTCVAFGAGRDEPVGVTLYYPLSPNLPSDAAVIPRLESLMRSEDLDFESYSAVARALAAGPADETSTQSWMGIKKANGTTVTVYFGPETYNARESW